MIVIKATAKVKPEERDHAIAAALVMAEATEAEEGNISYTFSSDLEDPNVFHLFEEWDNEEALMDHFITSHMAEFIGALGTVLVGDMPTTRYEVSSFGPL